MSLSLLYDLSVHDIEMTCNCRTCAGDKVQSRFNREIFRSLFWWHSITVHLSLECSDTEVKHCTGLQL